MSTTDNHDEREMLAFVLMPFDPEFNRVYHDLIVPALEEVGYEVRRANSVFDQRNILKDIIDYIAQADLIIAELSSLNANVMYELGIAHGLSKPTVMLTQDIAAVPFDLRSYRLITYSLNYSEVGKLQEQLKEVARRHKVHSITFGNPVTDFAPRDSQIRRRDAQQPQPSQGTATVPVTALVTRENTLPASPQTVEELGILDVEEDIERSQEAIKTYMERLTNISKRFETGVSPHLREMQTLANTPGTAARRRESVRSVATEITRFAEGVEAELPGLHDAWQRFGESSDKAAQIITIASPSDRDSARGLVTGAKEFEGTVQGVVTQLTTIRDSLRQLMGVSKDLNRAIRQAEQAFDGVIDTFSIETASAARVAGVVAERLDTQGGNPSEIFRATEAVQETAKAAAATGQVLLEFARHLRPPANPWLATAGIFADDPQLLPMLEEIYAARDATRNAENEVEDDAR